MNEIIVRERFAALTKYLIAHNISITTMESMTSGFVASLITDTEGSSAIMKGAFVTYSNEAKILQGVPADIIDSYGVYSCETAEAMAKACRKAYRADIGIGITGSTGNVDPNNADSVPGQVYIAVVYGDKSWVQKYEIPVQQTRFAYKLCAAYYVYEMIEQMIGKK